MSYEQAAASLLGGLRAYTSLHYQLKLFSGESILICDGASVSQIDSTLSLMFKGREFHGITIGESLGC